MHGLFSDRAVVREMTWLRILVLVILAQVASAQLCARTTRVRDCEDLYLDTAATSFSNDAGEETLSSTTITPTKGMHLRIWATVKIINGSVSGVNWTGKIYVGTVAVSTTAASNTVAGGTQRLSVYADVFIGVLGGSGIVTAVRENATSTAIVSAIATNIAAPATIKYTGTLATADPAISETNEAFRVEIVP